MKYIRRANHSDKEAISRLRINEFRRSSEFDLLLADQLRWNACDDGNIVLAAWNDQNEVVSTMRAMVVEDAANACDCLQCSVPDHIGYPAIVFSAAATHNTHRGQGLNQAIRYYYLLAALRCGIENILSPIYEGAPRIDFMRALGYEFVTPEKNWQTKLLPKSRRILGILPRAEMGRAVEYLRKHRSEVLAAYPWRGAPFRFPVRDLLKVN